MKVLIPLAGAGTRLRPFTHTQPKSLIPLAGKPIIGHILDTLISDGFDDFVFVIGYMGNKLRNYISTTYPLIRKRFVYQEVREGLGQAVWTSKSLLADEDELMIVLGDLIFDMDLQLIRTSKHSILATAIVQDPRDFGVVTEDENEKVLHAIEKPRIPKSNKAIVGIYKIMEVKLLFECLNDIISSGTKTAGEYQLTDAIEMMIKKGVHFTTCPVNNWFDCGRTDVLLDTNKLILTKNGNQIHNINRSGELIIIPPVYIGDSSEIENSIIGPFVTIGPHTKIKNAIINNSIIGDHTILDNVVLNDSVIGCDSAVKGYGKKLNIGDNTIIDLRPE